jgi:hypothetical protein
MLDRFVSERDFVTGFILPRFKEASKVLGKGDVVDFHVEKPVDGITDLTAERGGRGLFVLEDVYSIQLFAAATYVPAVLGGFSLRLAAKESMSLNGSRWPLLYF